MSKEKPQRLFAFFPCLITGALQGVSQDSKTGPPKNLWKWPYIFMDMVTLKVF